MGTWMTSTPHGRTILAAAQCLLLLALLASAREARGYGEVYVVPQCPLGNGCSNEAAAAALRGADGEAACNAMFPGPTHHHFGAWRGAEVSGGEGDAYWSRGVQCRGTGGWAATRPVRAYRNGQACDDPRATYDPVARTCAPPPPPVPGFGIDPGKSNTCDATVGSALVGNPCNVLTGAKIEVETDFEGPGALVLKRHYTSMPALAAAELGLGWRHSYMRSLSIDMEAGSVRLDRENGDSYLFSRTDEHLWAGDVDVPFDVEEVLEAGSTIGWTVTGPSGTTERYDISGQLRRIEFVTGDALDLAYDRARLQSVVDRQGRALIFSYVDGRLDAVGTPDGRLIQYAYDPTSRNLTSATYQLDEFGAVSVSRRYGYADPYWPTVLTSIDDESTLRYATWTYDPATGRVLTSTHGDPAGLVDRVSIAYSSTGAVVTNSLEGQTEYGRTVQHARAKVSAVSETCMDCEVASRTYDANGYPDLVTDSAGVTTDFDYDARGLLVNQVDAKETNDQRTTHTEWHPQFRVPIERRLYDATNNLVARTTWSYNDRGQELTTSSHDSATGAVRTTTTHYCEQSDIDVGTCPLTGLVTAIDGPRTDVADVTTYQYYSSDDASCASTPTTCPHRKGDLWKVTNALGHVIEIRAYDGAGRPLSVRDANGVITDLAYHPRGWLVARKVRGIDDTVETDDAINGIEYTPTGLVSKIMDADGVYTRYEYDQAHRLTTIEDGAGNRIEYRLDNAGNRIKEETIDVDGHLLREMSRIYDHLGRLETVADAHANPTDFTYDAAGNVETVTDAYRRVTDHDYDPLGRLRRTLQDVAGIAADTAFTYDAQDRLTRVTDPKGLDTVYDYNAFGDLMRLHSPDTGVTTYEYDSAGNRIAATDARGETTTYLYDALNRLTAVGYSDSSLNVTYVYDFTPTSCGAGEAFAIGRLAQMTDGSGSTAYCHDRHGNLVRKIQVTNGLTFDTAYAYSVAGRLTTITYPGGARVAYPRNALGQQIGVSVTSATGIQSLLTDVVWYPFGPAAELTYGDGRRLQRSLDRNYQPGFIEDTAAGGLSLGFAFDAVGNLRTLRKGDQSEPPLRTYEYDTLHRLTAAMDGVTGTPLQEYAYDATGNRTGSTAAGIASVYTYPPDSHRLAQVDAVPRKYDPAGNTTAIGPRSFVYTAANRMGQVLRDGVVVGEYLYNGRGEQVWRQAQVGLDCTGPDRESAACRGGGRDNNPCEDLTGRERGECERDRHQPHNPGPPDEVTLQATTFVYGESGQLLGQYDETGAALQEIIWLDDLPVGLVTVSGTESKLFHIQADHLGTPRLVIDPAREQVVWTWALTGEAFGNEAPNEDPDGDGSAFVFDLRFPGQRYDAASELNYNYFRDYDPNVGRYSQSDPIGLFNSNSTYSYVDANPSIFRDSLGLFRCGAGQRVEWRWKRGIPRWQCVASANPSGRYPYKNPTGEAAFFHPDANTVRGRCQTVCVAKFLVPGADIVIDQGIKYLFWGAARTTLRIVARIGTVSYDAIALELCLDQCETYEGEICK